jgi:glutamine---fructose-6-phosphate transaminase (isomerizing)
MDPTLFLSDIEAKPSALRALADAVEQDGALRWPAIPRDGRTVLVGMGSSWFAAQVAAQRLRRDGIVAVAELASVESTWPMADDVTVVAISASGGSTETLDFVSRTGGARQVIALTNTADSRLLAHATTQVDMLAGVEASGVACRSYLHTLITLLALESQLSEASIDVAAICRTAADSIETLLSTRDRWLTRAAELLAGPNGIFMLAPAERIGSALQGALMLREVPRRPADGCETGDWSHVDVYLTKTLDYRALVFAGSRYDGEASRWMHERGTTAVAVGGAFADAAFSIPYPHADDPLNALLVEVTVAELLAAEYLNE